MSVRQMVMAKPVADFDLLADIPWEHAYWAEGPKFEALGYTTGNQVTNWKDEIGTADLTGSSTAVTFQVAGGPNSKPAVQLADTLASYLAATFPTIYTQPFSIVLIGRQTATGSTNRHVVDAPDTTNRAVIVIVSGVWAIETTSYASTGVSANTSNHLHAAVYNGASSQFETDGTPSASVNTGTGGMDGMHLNAFTNGGGNAGQIRSFVGIYSGDVRTDPAWPDLESWVESYYGLPIA